MSAISITTHLRLIIYGPHINHGEYMSAISITTHLRLMIYGPHINHGEYMSAILYHMILMIIFAVAWRVQQQIHHGMIGSIVIERMCIMHQCILDPMVTVKCRTAITVLFLYFNVCLSIKLDSLSCSFTFLSFHTNICNLLQNVHIEKWIRNQLN